MNFIQKTLGIAFILIATIMFSSQAQTLKNDKTKTIDKGNIEVSSLNIKRSKDWKTKLNLSDDEQEKVAQLLEKRSEQKMKLKKSGSKDMGKLKTIQSNFEKNLKATIGGSKYGKYMQLRKTKGGGDVDSFEDTEEI